MKTNTKTTTNTAIETATATELFTQAILKEPKQKLKNGKRVIELLEKNKIPFIVTTIDEEVGTSIVIGESGTFDGTTSLDLTFEGNIIKVTLIQLHPIEASVETVVTETDDAKQAVNIIKSLWVVNNFQYLPWE